MKKSEPRQAVHTLFHLKYHKLSSLIISILLAYFIFKTPIVQSSISHLGNLGYVGMFISGFLFSFGFATAFSIGFMFVLNPANIILASIIGGIGATFSTLIIFYWIRNEFLDEFQEIEEEPEIKKFVQFIHHHFSHTIRVYLIYIFAGIIIATPLPNEIGVTLLAGLTKVKVVFLTITSLILNTLGIYILLALMH